MKLTQFFDDSKRHDAFQKNLRMSSINPVVANQRNSVYESVMDTERAVRDAARSLGYFSSSADMAPSQMGVALAEASLKAYINSFAGYIAIERPMTQMRQTIIYTDVVTKSGAMVMPNIGPDTPRGRAEGSIKVNLTAADKTETILLASAVVPGSFMFQFKINGVTTTGVDNRKGKILAEGNVLDIGTIDYNLGTIEITTGPAPIAGDYIQVNYEKDQVVDLSAGRTKPKQGYFNVDAKVNKYEFEVDLISAAINKTTVGSDVIDKMKTSVYDEHTLAINNALVGAIKANYIGTTLTIDLDAFSIAAGMFDSLLRVFNAGLVSVDGAIASRTYKAVAATAYVVGNTVANLFGSLDDSFGWVPNNTGYVNGLIGFYKGRAVLRHLSLDATEIFAVHKTPDGDLAPTALGILLPATDLPLVGNFNNTNEIAGGIYSVDGATSLAKDLVQRVNVLFPADWMLTA